MLGPPVQARPLHGHVHAQAGCLTREGPPESVGLAPGHHELVARHRVGRQADDPLHVGPAASDVAEDAGQSGRPEIGGQQGDQVPGSDVAGTSRPGLEWPHGDVEGRRLELAAERRRHPSAIGGVSGELEAEQQPAVDPDLLDVEDPDTQRDEGGEHLGRDPGPVAAGHRDEQARVVHAHHARHGDRRAGRAVGRRRAQRRPMEAREPPTAPSARPMATMASQVTVVVVTTPAGTPRASLELRSAAAAIQSPS